MTRRERMMRILENHGTDRADWELAGMRARRGRFGQFDLLTDEAIDELAGRLVIAGRRQQRMNAENRRIAKAKGLLREQA